MAICELATNSGSGGRGKPVRSATPAKSAALPFENSHKVVPIRKLSLVD